MMQKECEAELKTSYSFLKCEKCKQNRKNKFKIQQKMRMEFLGYKNKKNKTEKKIY